MHLANCYSVTKIDKSIRKNFTCYNCANTPNHAIFRLSNKIELYCLCAKDVKEIDAYVHNLDSIPLFLMKKYLLINKFEMSSLMKLILGIQ